MLLISLAFFICLAYASEVQSSTGRFLAGSSIGDCFIVSSKYKTLPTNATGDVFAAVMGKGLGGLGYPYTALAYVSGSVDLDKYNKSYAQINIDAAGSVAAWAFVAIGEFCDVNGEEGYQRNSDDYVISYIPAAGLLLGPYTQTCGSSVSGETTTYYSTVGSSKFNTTCYVTSLPTTRNGKFVDENTIKCDVRIDYSTLWSKNFLLVRNCSDSQRKIGVVMNVIGATFDLDVSVDASFNGKSGSTTEEITFGKGSLKFEWDNFVSETSSFSGNSGKQSRVTYGYIGNNGTSSSFYGATNVQQAIFSFATPKSDGKNTFYWDPSFSVNGVSSLTPIFGLVFAVIALFLF